MIFFFFLRKIIWRVQREKKRKRHRANWFEARLTGHSDMAMVRHSGSYISVLRDKNNKKEHCEHWSE